MFSCMCVCARVRALLSLSICVVGVPWRLMIFHLVEVSGRTRACAFIVLAEDRPVLPASSCPCCFKNASGILETEADGSGSCVCVCLGVEAARPFHKPPQGTTLGPSGGQIRGS